MADEYAITYSDKPELWEEGLSYLCKVEDQNGSQAVFAGGWHRRQIAFEYPSVTFEDSQSGEGVIQVGGEFAFGNAERFEIELALNGDDATEAVGLLERFVDKHLADQMVGSIDSFNTRVSANRKDAPLLDANGLEIAHLDLLTQNLPARAGNMSEPLRMVERWCRIFELPNGTVTIYRPLTAAQKQQLRWPHNCVWLNRGAHYFAENTPVGDIAEAVLVPLKYLIYNLDNWRVEFEFWQNEPFQILASSDAKEATARLLVAQRDMGLLSDYLTRSYLALRNITRRASSNPIVVAHPEVGEEMRATAERVGERVTENRALLREVSGQLANVAQSVQTLSNQERTENAERTSTILTFASVLFFIPTLIISFFSMSIIGVDSAIEVPSTVFVLLLCVASVVVVLGAFMLYGWIYRTRSRRRKEKEL